MEHSDFDEITHGGQIGDVDEISASLLEVVRGGNEPGALALFNAWKSGADKLAELAEEGRHTSKACVGGKLGRPTLYYFNAEHMQAHGFEERLPFPLYSLNVFRDGMRLARRIVST